MAAITEKRCRALKIMAAARSALTPEHRSQRMRTRWNDDYERMAETAKANARKANAALRGRRYTPEMSAKYSAALTGCKMTGKCAATPDHIFAEQYSFRAPSGDVYRGQNIAHFIRTHKHLFSPSDIDSRGAAFGKCRASQGLYSLRPHTRHAKKSWKGWTWAH